MSIDRNSYLSLIESVNEAVSPPKRGRLAKSRPTMRSAGGGGQGGGDNKPIGWGDPRIGGATNPMELAQWLNKQTVPGLSEGAFKTANVTKSKPKMISPVKTKTKSPATTASTAAGMAKRTASVAAGSGLQWGDKSIGGAMSGYDLARFLNSQSSPGMMKEGMSEPDMSNPKKPKKPKNVPLPPPDPNRNNPVTGPLAEDEDFDIIDEILAEGLELYGEEDLAEILADFEETGEISEELADLLGLEIEFVTEVTGGTGGTTPKGIKKGILPPPKRELKREREKFSWEMSPKEYQGHFGKPMPRDLASWRASRGMR